MWHSVVHEEKAAASICSGQIEKNFDFLTAANSSIEKKYLGVCLLGPETSEICTRFITT